MLSDACGGETGMACTDEAMDSVNAITITLVNVASHLLSCIHSASSDKCGHTQLPRNGCDFDWLTEVSTVNLHAQYDIA
jgi:hypothetical protein